MGIAWESHSNSKANSYSKIRDFKIMFKKLKCWSKHPYSSMFPGDNNLIISIDLTFCKNLKFCSIYCLRKSVRNALSSLAMFFSLKKLKVYFTCSKIHSKVLVYSFASLDKHVVASSPLQLRYRLVLWPGQIPLCPSVVNPFFTPVLWQQVIWLSSSYSFRFSRISDKQNCALFLKMPVRI